MGFVETEQKKILSLVYLGLLFFLVVLGILFIGGTIYGVFFHTASQKNAVMDISAETEEGQTFTGIGRIRVPTKDPQPGMVILFVSFVYYPNDKTFSEELALRVGDFRDIIENYIGSFSITELHALSEEDIKAELLRRFNALLRLGQIHTLFFSDFMIIG